MEESSRMARLREREAIHRELDRILDGLDDGADPEAAEWRLAGMSEGDREEVRALRLAFAGLDRACRSRTVRPGRPGGRITFRMEGGKLVRVAQEGEPPWTTTVGPRANGAVREASSSPPAAAAGSEEELCSAFTSARF